ncbi:hypothetical protein V6Z88_001664 [Aspergillus fumigatus]
MTSLFSYLISRIIKVLQLSASFQISTRLLRFPLIRPLPLFVIQISNTMAPNLFICLRAVFCPTYWFQRGERIQGSIFQEEHWESPVPGIYKYIPGRGWHLVQRDDSEYEEKVPVPLVYCRILHRYIFEHEMEDRCRWQSVTLHEGAKPERLLFFLLDDGYTWVAGWDAKGTFIPGPYQKWHYDHDTKTMQRVVSPESSNVSRCSSIVPTKMG